MVTESQKTRHAITLVQQKEQLKNNWLGIRKLYRKCIQSNRFAAIASVNTENIPTVTPIGSLFLNKDETTGFYFEKFTSSIRKNAVQNPNICVLAVNSGFWFWLKSLFSGKFKHYPSIKLYGVVGKLRDATEAEQARIYRRLNRAKGLKGYDLLWGEMSQVREIDFYHFETTKLGKMSQLSTIG
ncbi:MAG: pyridoxamine 5'-phosphate oxidase family protein [Flammeovirgaceae bacterium]